MKICDITHFYCEKSGGVKTYLLKKVDYLGHNNLPGTEHFLILPYHCDSLERKNNSRFYFVKSPAVPLFKPYRFLINKSKIKNILTSEHPDIVEVGSPYMIPAWIKEFSTSLKYKVVGFYHAHIEATWNAVLKGFEGSITKLSRAYIKKTYGDMDLVLAASRYVEKYLNQLGISHTKTVYLGVDSVLFSIGKGDPNFRKEHNISENRRILLFTGRFAQEKRIFKIIDMFIALNNLHKNKYHLVLVGGGPEENKIRAMNVKEMTVIPFCSDKEKLVSIYNSADIFVTASNSETFGLTLLEAQCCGLPVVAFQETSIPEIVVRKELLAETENDFIHNIETIANLLSDNLKSEIREQTVQHFSWDASFKKLIGIYYELWGSDPPS